MARNNAIKMELPSVDDLFTTQEERDEAKAEKIMNIPLEEISSFPNHPFKVKMDEEMIELADSINQHGILVPVLVRPKAEGGYEMVAGHRRLYASELAEKEEIPCIVRDLSDEEATIIMVDSNLQREKILPSEKAFAYKMKLEAIKRQAGRPSKNSATVLQDFHGKTSRQIIAEQMGESHEQIRKYIRLTELIPPLLEMVDNNQIAMRPAVELSYLSKEEQEILQDVMEYQDCTPSHAQAIELRKLSENGELNEDMIIVKLSEEKGNQKEQFHIAKERIDRYFPKGTSKKKMEDVIIKALDLYMKRERARER